MNKEKFGLEVMTHEQAMKILDRVREGQQYPEHVITMALKLTGDLEDE
jgi:hypothetical protein